MATHSSILAWRIPQTEEPDWLQFMGLPRVRHNLATEQQQWDSNNYYNKSCSVPPKKFKGSSERASLVVQTVKNSPAMQETWVLSLGQEDPLEKGMGTHSSIFAWRIPWTEELGGLQSIWSQRVNHD